jgi:hypothetical protein
VPEDYPCPACGFLVFGAPPGTYDICPVCGWEDDHVQLAHPALRGGANKQSLFECQRGVLSKLPVCVREHAGWHRDAEWRPLRGEELTSEGCPTSGLQYFQAAGEDTPGYYWRDRRE